jgi:hypothetical protein
MHVKKDQKIPNLEGINWGIGKLRNIKELRIATSTVRHRLRLRRSLNLTVACCCLRKNVFFKPNRIALKTWRSPSGHSPDHFGIWLARSRIKNKLRKNKHSNSDNRNRNRDKIFYYKFLFLRWEIAWNFPSFILAFYL